jgi:hypothetical protein
MHEGVDILDRRCDRCDVPNVAAYEVESLMTIKRKQGLSAIDQLIENGHPVSGLEQMSRDARSKIPSAASDKDFHGDCQPSNELWIGAMREINRIPTTLLPITFRGCWPVLGGDPNHLKDPLRGRFLVPILQNKVAGGGK